MIIVSVSHLFIKADGHSLDEGHLPSTGTGSPFVEVRMLKTAPRVIHRAPTPRTGPQMLLEAPTTRVMA